MKIGICGGGPAGLYFALLMKKSNPAHAITVVEQNPADATYGWGVVFSGRALGFLEAGDPDSYADIARRLETWDDQTIVHHDQTVRIDGYGFSGIARIDLLTILQEHCRRRGVVVQFNTRLTDLSAFADCDLIVAADGAHSVVRQTYAAQFQPAAETLSNKYVWYGATQRFDTLSLTFRENADGAFVAHHYRYAPNGSTFIVECDVGAWQRAGFAQMSEDASRRYCEQVFTPDLGQRPLLTNKSTWLNFRAMTNKHWIANTTIVLLGDALRTVHFSIGSGTRMALEDALALHRAFQSHDAVAPALRAFEAAHRPAVEQFLQVARQLHLV
jgi:anthraniloyl-CoA monooxygenase